MAAHAPWRDVPSRPSALDSRVRLPHGSETEPRPVTGREKEVWLLLALGASRYEVAYELGVSLYTVRNHIERLQLALDCHTTRELIVLWYGAVPWSRLSAEERAALPITRKVRRSRR